MKRMISVVCVALMLCIPSLARDRSEKEAERAALIKAVNECNFNVTVIKNIPQSNNDAVKYYDGDGYIIRVRGNDAVIFIPGINKGGYMQFGGGNSGTKAAELVEATCELKSHKGKTWKFVLKEKENVHSEITLLVAENGSVRISVDKLPMTHFAFYGEASVPVTMY